MFSLNFELCFVQVRVHFHCCSSMIAILSYLKLSYSVLVFSLMLCIVVGAFFKLLLWFYLLISMSHVFINLKLLGLHKIM